MKPVSNKKIYLFNTSFDYSKLLFKAFFHYIPSPDKLDSFQYPLEGYKYLRNNLSFNLPL